MLAAPSPSPFGAARSPFGTVASQAHLSAQADDLSTPGGVISAKLVPFNDVASMQQQNAQLLRAVRVVV